MDKREADVFPAPAQRLVIPYRLTGKAPAADSSLVKAQFRQAVEAFQSGDLDRARSLAEAEVSDAPTPQAHHLLGLVHCRLGDPATGIEHLRLAADGEPANAAFQIMLMRALVDAGRASDVLDMPEPADIRSAVTLELWRSRGEAANLADRANDAIRAWSKITAAVPSDWRAWASLGNALALLSRWPEAIESFTKAVRLQPSEASLRRSLGTALAAAERHEEALAAFDDFERLAEQSADSALARARCLLALERFKDSEEAYREAIRLSPSDSEALRELGSLLERTNQLEALSALLDTASKVGVNLGELDYLFALKAFREGCAEDAHEILQSSTPDDDLVRWNRLKAKVADRLGDVEEAFEAAAAMNAATSDFDTWRVQGEKYRERLRYLAKMLARQAAHLPKLDQPPRRMPAFLVGFPRSGTTLLDTFLMGHGETAVLEEVHLLGAAEGQIGKVEDLPGASMQSLKRAREAYFNELDQHVPRSFSGLVIDKLPLNLLGAPFIQSLFPGACIIFAQRHPCDAVLSGFMQSFVMNDAMASFLTIEDAADLYDSVLSGWRTIVEAFPLKVHTVRYERLVEDPEAELRPLIEFLGLDWDERMLAHTETARTRGAIITPSYDQVTEPLTSRSVGRWRRYEEQLRPVLPVLMPWAKWLGYTD